MQLREREALGLGWVIQNESQSGFCWNESSAVGQAALLRQGFPRGEPQEWPSLMTAEGNYRAVQQTVHARLKKKPGFKGSPLISANAQPGREEIPEGGGTPAVKAGTCKRLSSWSRQERSWWPTPGLKQALFLSNTPGLRVPLIPLMPQINNKGLLAAEKLLKTSTGQADPGHSLLFQHFHFLCRAHRYSGNAALNFSRALLQMAFSLHSQLPTPELGSFWKGHCCVEWAVASITCEWYRLGEHQFKFSPTANME